MDDRDDAPAAAGAFDVAAGLGADAAGAPGLPAVVAEADAGRAHRRRPQSRFPKDAETFLARIAAGQSRRAIHLDRRMPSYGSVQRWLLAEPGFAERYAEAKAAAGDRRRGRPSLWSEPLAAEICDRLADGEALHRICEEPGMPDTNTVFRWLHARPEFRSAYAFARELQAHRLFDEATLAVDEADAAGAHLARVRAGTKLKQAARLAPRVFGERLERAEDGPAPVVQVWRVHKYGDEDDEGVPLEEWRAKTIAARAAMELQKAGRKPAEEVVEAVQAMLARGEI